MYCERCNSVSNTHPTQPLERHQANKLTLIAGLIGACFGAITGPQVFDLYSPMHPIEKMFFPLRDPLMSLSGAVLVGSASAILVNQLSKKIFS